MGKAGLHDFTTFSAVAIPPRYPFVMLQVIIGAGVILAAVLLREVIARVGHQRALLRREVNELTNLFPLWLSRFHPEFEQLHSQFPPPLEFISPPISSGRSICAAMCG